MNKLIDTIHREICGLRDELGEINWLGQKQENPVQGKAVRTITVDFAKADYFIDLLKRNPNMRGAEMRNYLDGWLRSFRSCNGGDSYESKAVLVNSLAESLQAQAQRVVTR